jgi:Acetyltransferase (GNAT) domain
MKLFKYSDEKEAEWDEFVRKRARNASFLHSRSFFLHNEQNKKDDASLLFYKRQKLICVFPAAWNCNEVKTLESHPRATYGGYVFSEALGVEEMLEIVAQTISFAQDSRAHKIIVRQPLRIYQKIPSDEADYALWRLGFKVHHRSVEACIDLSHPVVYSNQTKRNVFRHKDDLQVVFSEELAIFHDLLVQNLQDKHNVMPVHSLVQLQKLRVLNPENIRLVLCFNKNKAIAGILLFCSETVLHAQYIASNYEYQSLRPLNVLIDFLREWGKLNGFLYLNLGSVNEQEGQVLNKGLLHFKEGFGARTLLRETLTFDFV